MGLLLGASLMTVAEIFELCLELIPGCGRLKQKQKSNNKHGNSNGTATHDVMIPERIVVTE